MLTCDRRKALAERMGDAERMAHISNNLGWLAYCLGDADQAIEHYSYSLQVWTASGGRVMSAIVRTNLGAAELANGDSSRALAYLNEAVAALEEAGARGQLAETRRYLALAHLAAGDLAAAREAAELALALAREAEAPLDEAGAQRVLGQIALAAGELDEAVAALEASRDPVEQPGKPLRVGADVDRLGGGVPGTGSPSRGARPVGRGSRDIYRTRCKSRFGARCRATEDSGCLALASAWQRASQCILSSNSVAVPSDLKTNAQGSVGHSREASHRPARARFMSSGSTP